MMPLSLLLQAADPQLPPTTGVFIVFTVIKMIAIFTLFGLRWR